MLSTMILALAFLASSASEPVANNSNEAQVQTAKVKAKKICRMGDDTGSRITSKRCKTQKEWDDLDNRSDSGDKSRSGMTLKP